MVRGFEIPVVLLVALAHGSLALAAGPAADICQPRDDKADTAAIDAYFTANLKEHDAYSFSRPLRESARAAAKTFLEQRIAEKRAEICAAHLKLVEDVKTAAASYSTAECSAAAVVGLLDQYMTKAAGAYDQNRQLLNSLRTQHENNLQSKLFNIVRGSTSGLDGTYKGFALSGAPHDLRVEWVKQEATKLGAEAHIVWGATKPEANPLFQRNLDLAREAVRAKQERDAARTRFHTDGKLPASCKPKS